LFFYIQNLKHEYEYETLIRVNYMLKKIRKKKMYEIEHDHVSNVLIKGTSFLVFSSNMIH